MAIEAAERNREKLDGTAGLVAVFASKKTLISHSKPFIFVLPDKQILLSSTKMDTKRPECALDGGAKWSSERLS